MFSQYNFAFPVYYCFLKFITHVILINWVLLITNDNSVQNINFNIPSWSQKFVYIKFQFIQLFVCIEE